MNYLTSIAIHQYLIGLIFIGAGILHFIKPRVYLSIMPSYLPYPKQLVFWSGVFELLGGLGFLIPSLRLWAAWGLILLLVAVFPANIEMFIKRFTRKGLFNLYSVLSLIRLPLQFLLIYWVYWAGINGN